jgi:hypothetical protein
MADYRAIWAVAEAVVVELQSRCCPPEIGADLGFQVYGSRDFSDRPIENGASLFVHRIMVSGTHRTPAGRVLPGGARLRNRLPVEVHFLLTIWGGQASTQLTLAGWIMRMLEDNPLLSPATLNASGNPVYGPDEVVEIMPAELTNEDLLRLWDTLGSGVVYQLSLPYVARVIQIDSVDPLPADGGGAVQRRRLDVGELLS